jgi:hypothetical protein
MLVAIQASTITAMPATIITIVAITLLVIIISMAVTFRTITPL